MGIFKDLSKDILEMQMANKRVSGILWCKLLTARSWFLHFKHKRCRPERLVSTRNEIFNLSAAVHVSKTFVHEPPIFLDPEDVLIISNFSASSDFFYY